jgi:putative membrane protein
VSAKALASMKSSWRLSLESLLPAAVVAAVQSVVLTVLMTALLDLGAGQVVRLLGLSLLAGLVFVALNHALVAWFGGVGRFVSVVLVVLTAAAALTSAVPEVFDSVTPLLPLTPALQGMRAVVTGNGGGAQAALLLAWLVVGLAAGVLATARHRTVRSNALVAAPAR